MPILLIVVAVVLDYLYPLPHDPCLQYCSLLGAALGVAGATSVLGSLLGYKSNQETNETSMDVAQMNNQREYDLFNASMEYNKYTYEDQKAWNEKLISMMNDYNSPSAQMSRYRNAGINPYFALGNVDAGNMNGNFGVSPNSAPSIPSFQQPNLRPYDWNSLGAVGRDLGSVMQAVSNTDLSAAQAENQRIRNIYEAHRQVAEIDKILASGKVDKEQGDILRETKKDLIQQAKLDTMRMREDSMSASELRKQHVLDTKLKENETKMIEWRNQFEKKLGDKQLNQLDAIIFNTRADSALKAAQEVAEKAKKVGIDISNDQIKQLTPLLVTKQKLENQQIELENKYGSNAWSAGGRWYERYRTWLRKRAEYSFGLNGTSRWD